MEVTAKAFDLFWELYHKDLQFQNYVTKSMQNGHVRFFNDQEWMKICSQNFISFVPEINHFIDTFILGYNIGDCVGVSQQLSYSYDDVDIVAGILPILKGSLNAELEGGHRWLETPNTIIDTSLMLVIDKSLKNIFGYLEEQRLTSYQLSMMPHYQKRKEFVLDKSVHKSI